MDLHATTDFFSLAEEKFDFDISLSPASSKGDDEEDEVFVGPFHHKERCISVGVETLAKDSVSSGLSVGEGLSWSPLGGDKFEEICKEAHHLAGQLEGYQQQQPQKEETNGTPTESQDELKEEFVQDTGNKLHIFRKPADVVLSPIKRETFCVQDSPMKQLPPAIQKQILKDSGRAGFGVVSNTAKARLGTSSPLSGAKTQPKMALRGRAGLATGRVLPSKPAAPAPSTVSLNAAKARAAPAEKRLPPPSKCSAGMRRSLASHRSSRASSCDELSDTGSVASDVSDSSLNSSLQGRRALAPPTKTALRNLSAVKAPPPQTRRATDRRNTSSSSSSISSFNSSLSVSPTVKGKLDASLNSSVSGPSGRVPTSVSRLANPSMNATKTRRSTVYGKAPEPPPLTSTNATRTGTRRSISVQARKPSEADHSKPVRPTPVKRAQPGLFVAPTPLTPAKRAMERTSSVPNVSLPYTAKPQIGARANPKPKAFIAPTPTSQLRSLSHSGAVSSPDAPRIMKPKRLMSACSIDSLPQKPAIPAPELLQTPQASRNKSLQAKLRRNSALPTPVNRRVSGIPTMTPKSLSRPGRHSPSMSHLPASTRMASSWSPTQVKTAAVSEEEPPEVHVQLQPFSLEDEEQAVPVAPQPEMREMATSPIKVSQDNTEPGREVLEHPETNLENQHPEVSGDLMQLHSTEDTHPQTHGTKTQEVNEVLLVDAPPPVMRLQEKLLIDLSNTPDLVRTAPVKPSSEQLIDLSSPLIKWSPEDKKENAINDAPLINLSF